MGPFGFGSGIYPGASKLIEEMGEVAQLLGKLIQTDGGADHWDGTDLHQRLHEELADLGAAMRFFTLHGDFNLVKISECSDLKLARFEQWHVEERAKVGARPAEIRAHSPSEASAGNPAADDQIPSPSKAGEELK